MVSQPEVPTLRFFKTEKETSFTALFLDPVDEGGYFLKLLFT